MRHSIVIDDKPIAEAIRATGARTGREAVERGINTLLRLRRQNALRGFRGKPKRRGDLGAHAHGTRVILGGSSVRADHCNGRVSAETHCLDAPPVAVGDLILTQVLQGFGRDADYAAAREPMGSLTRYELLRPARPVETAQNRRAPRKRGTTVRKTSDANIATSCIEQGMPPPCSGRDFDRFVLHRRLKPAQPRA